MWCLINLKRFSNTQETCLWGYFQLMREDPSSEWVKSSIRREPKKRQGQLIAFPFWASTGPSGMATVAILCWCLWLQSSNVDYTRLPEIHRKLQAFSSGLQGHVASQTEQLVGFCVFRVQMAITRISNLYHVKQSNKFLIYPSSSYCFCSLENPI